MRNRPQPFQLYRHFKGNTYQIMCIAVHSETGEEMVVYQALYGDYKVYVRPLSMFMEPVDRQKYPNVSQEYRFELISAEKASAAVAPTTVSGTDNDAASSVPGPAVSSSDDEEPVVLDPDVERFLDARSYEERINILTELRDRITDDMIDIMSTVIDIEVPKAQTTRRYDLFMNALVMRRHYEAHRLRF